MRENYNLDQTVITYERTGQSTNTDALGMRELTGGQTLCEVIP